MRIRWKAGWTDEVMGSCWLKEEGGSMNPKFLGWPERGTRGSKWVTFMSPDAHQPDVKPRWVVKASTVDGCSYILDQRSPRWERSSDVWVWGFWLEIRSEVIDVDVRVVVDEFVACQRHLARLYKPKFALLSDFFSENVSPGALPWQISHSVIHFHSQPKLDLPFPLSLC